MTEGPLSPEDYEEGRIRALRRTRLLDTPPEERFDKLTRLAAALFGTPVALISLIDESRQWFKSRVGVDVAETPRELAFCAHAIQTPNLMVVNDALADNRFATNPFVTGDPKIRFYAGAPLQMPTGERLGTLCVLDRRPRVLAKHQQELLAHLAEAVVDQITLRDLVDENRRQVELLTMAEEISAVGHWRLDIMTGALFWSPQVYRIHGRDPATFKPTLENSVAAYHADDRTRMSRALDDAATAQRNFDFHLRLIRADGAVRIVGVRLQRQLDREGRVDALFGVLEDVTKRREIEGRLAHAEKMASIGTLAAGVAHEVNNPLSYMKANADMMAEEIAEMSGVSPSSRLRDLAERVAEIREGTRRIHHIVKGLKAFSRASAKKTENIDLSRILDMAVRLASHELRHRAELVCDFATDTPVVMGDESQLVQVAVNLIVNAAQAIPDGHRAHNVVTLSCGRTADGKAFFMVADTGKGMAPETLRQAFTPFFTTKAQDVGTGLGLAISHGIITSHGGTIAADSKEGEGTTIRVELPSVARVDLDAQTAPRAAAHVAPAQSFDVLVVDDDRLVAQSLARLLRGHRVTLIERAADALAMLVAGAHFDVIVCDLMMPNMSGRELFAALSEQVPAMAARMVFVTGAAFAGEGPPVPGHAPVPVLDKPVDVAELRATITRIATRASS